jgi:D-alanyl-D-alanine carboxypeptidase
MLKFFSFTTTPILKTKSKLFTYEVVNTNLSINNIPNILFSKTGYTELAGGNLTIIFRNQNEHLVAVTVLSSTQNDRFSDVEKIVNIMYNYPYEI